MTSRCGAAQTLAPCTEARYTSEGHFSYCVDFQPWLHNTTTHLAHLFRYLCQSYVSSRNILTVATGFSLNSSVLYIFPLISDTQIICLLPKLPPTPNGLLSLSGYVGGTWQTAQGARAAFDQLSIGSRTRDHCLNGDRFRRRGEGSKQYPLSLLFVSFTRPIYLLKDQKSSRIMAATIHDVL